MVNQQPSPEQGKVRRLFRQEVGSSEPKWGIPKTHFVNGSDIAYSCMKVQDAQKS
jgi:hypothetical protein